MLTFTLCVMGQDSYITYIEAAKKGDANAQVEIGNCYYNGAGVNKDYGQALHWYKKAASKNNPAAQYNIGMLYNYGFGVKKDLGKAVSWYTKSAQQGYAMAQYNLGCCCLYGQGITQNQQQALLWFKMGSEQNHTPSLYNAGMCYYNGWGIEKNPTMAAKYFQKAADLGHSAAQLNLGVCYKTGAGVQKDESKAVYWYQKAADQGETIAMSNLGACYLGGFGIQQDYSKAVYWLEKAVAGGYSQANQQLAEARAKLRENPSSASLSQPAVKTTTGSSKYDLNIEAAKKGDPKAQNTIGLCYSSGNGVEKNKEKAVYWYRKSAEQGYSIGEYNLALRYHNGEGVTQDYEQAMYWYRKSAEQGVADAMNNIGVLYKYGRGVKKDYGQAVSWFQKAADKGNKKGKENLEKTKKLMQEEKQTAASPVDQQVPAGTSDNKNAFAVIIGNENYDNEVDVPYAENDANIFKQYVRTTLGIPDKQIRMMTNATLNNIRSAVRWLAQAMEICNGKGRVIFYYAGHGIPDESTQSAYLLPTDGMGSDVESAYSLKRLYGELGKMNAERVTVFLDACFSGAKREGGMMASARGIAIKAKPQEPEGKMVVFTAAQGDETAYPYKEMRHGMFTYYLLKKLQETKGDATLGELQEYLTDEVKRQSFIENNKMQTPSVTVSPAMGPHWKKMSLK